MSPAVGRVGALRRRLRPAAERGMATVELAAALPVLVLLVLAGVGAVRVADARVRCQDAARDVALAVARGDPAAGTASARAVSPAAHVTVSRSGDDVVATVRLAVRLVGGTGSITVRARAVAPAEPDTGPAP